MKLYYKPGACSLASHITLNEIGATFTLDKVDTDAKTTENGGDFLSVNPDGYVPALELSSGDIITEGAAVLQYLADQKPEAGLAPASGTLERARLQQHLNYVASELHKAFGPFFSGKELSAEQRSATVENVSKKLSHFEAVLNDGRDYLLGDTFTVADSYLFVVTNWSNFVGLDLSPWPNLQAFLGRVAARPAVQTALKSEGLLN